MGSRALDQTHFPMWDNKVDLNLLYSIHTCSLETSTLLSQWLNALKTY